MKASGTKLTLVVRVSTASLLIDPSGWSRSRSDAPWRMLNVPSVAMIDGRRRTRMSIALKIPVASPTPTSASAPGISPSADVVGRHRVRGDDDAQRHQRADGDVEAADEQRARLADRDEGERHRREQEVAEVVAREERVLAHGRVRADRDDQRRHQDERQRRRGT